MSHYPGAVRHAHDRSRRWIRPRGIAWWVLSGLVAAVLPVLVDTAPASAQVLGPGTPTIPGFSGYVLANNDELGIGRLPNGTYGVCTDTGGEFPWPAHPARSMVTNPRIAYALGKYVGPARSNGRLAAALWWAVGLDFGQNSQQARVRGHVDQLARENPPVFADVRALHDRIVADATDNASPVGGFHLDLGLAEDKAHTGAVTGVGVKGVSGWADGFDATVTLSGPATFDATGSKTWTGVTGDGPRSLAWTQSGPGSIAVTGTVSGLPDTQYERWWGGGNTQRVLAAADLVSVRDDAQLADDTGWARARKVDVDTGTPLAGAVFRAWGELPPGVDGVKSAGEPSQDLTTDAGGYTDRFAWFKGSQGAAQVCFRELKAPPGYQVDRAVHCVPASGGTAEVTVQDAVRRTTTPTPTPVGSWLPLTVTKTAEGNDPAGLAGVTVEVHEEAPTGPVVDSYTFAPGDVAADGRAGHTFAPSPDSCTSGCHYAEGSDYYVVVTAEPTGWLPASGVVQAILAPDGSSWTAQLDDRKIWTPTLVTQVSAQQVVPGATIADTVTVRDTGGHQVNGSWSLLGPAAPLVDAASHGPTCVGVDWSTAPVAGSGSFAISGDGDYKVGELPVGEAGCYTYTESAEATDLTRAVPPTLPGIPAETTLAVLTPRLSTEVPLQMAPVGAALHDTVTVTGAGDHELDGQWHLLGPLPPADSSVGRTCDGVDWSVAPVAAEGAFTADGDGTYAVGEHEVAATGCFTYTENLAATPETLGVPTTAAGIASETTLVTTGPTMVTQVSDQMVTVGGTLSDQVAVAGTAGAAVTGLWQLLGPLAPADADAPVRGIVRCTGLDWASAPVAAQGELAVAGDGTYTVGEVTVEDVGCYTYTESLPATGATEAVSTLPGIAAETLLVVSAPGLATRVSDRTAEVGDSISDSVGVRDTHGATVPGRWQLLGPVTPGRDGSCAGREWASAPVAAAETFEASGDGTYTVGAYDVTAAGCYTYRESLAGTATTLPVPWNEAGVPAETTLVAAVPVVHDATTVSIPRSTVRIEAGLGAARHRRPWLLLMGLALLVAAVGAALTAHLLARRRPGPPRSSR